MEKTKPENPGLEGRLNLDFWFEKSSGYPGIRVQANPVANPVLLGYGLPQQSDSMPSRLQDRNKEHILIKLVCVVVLQSCGQVLVRPR